MTSPPDFTTANLPSNSATSSQSLSPVVLVLASVAILLPTLMATMTFLPLPVRGASAIIGGLGVLAFGPYLVSHALFRWARRSATNLS